jgi:hypothetical protein
MGKWRRPAENGAARCTLVMAPGFVFGPKYLGITQLRHVSWSCHNGGRKKYFCSCANFASIRIDLIAYKRVPGACLWHLTYRETAVEAMPPGTGIAHIQGGQPDCHTYSADPFSAV